MKKVSEFFRKGGIRYAIFTYFTVTALVALILVGISIYGRLTSEFTEEISEENQAIISEVNRSLDTYLRNIFRLSDSIYYSVIKNADLSDESTQDKLSLLYQSNKDTVANIAVFDSAGSLLMTAPAARLVDVADITGEGWFTEALEKTETLCFSLPGVQHIFDNADNQYKWVITVSRSIEITEGTATDQGVLLIDINFDTLRQQLSDITLGSGGYLYLVGTDGSLIYHPRMQLIDAGLESESTLSAFSLKDGTYSETVDGLRTELIVKSVGYTGWKIVGVIPLRGLSLNDIKTSIFIVFIICFFFTIIAACNAYISDRITNPIKKLESSVNALEGGELDTPVYIGGSYEIRHLGSSISEMAVRIKALMSDIVAEHEAKRKSEFDTLQSQINPHFLYNTLDIIVWMIENEQREEAARAVTALARFFRISLSKGKNIIALGDELEHVRSYLTIQKMRFKNKFTYEIDAAPETLGLQSLKLMLQPLVENSIYHGMEMKDGDGRIVIRTRLSDGELLITVGDNGPGMAPEEVARLLDDEAHVPSRRGSGIGVRNVNERIRLYFGPDYGLTIESEPDEGTLIAIRLPILSMDSLKEDGT